MYKSPNNLVSVIILPTNSKSLDMYVMVIITEDKTLFLDCLTLKIKVKFR
jgi:hypothetical protein